MLFLLFEYVICKHYLELRKIWTLQTCSSLEIEPIKHTLFFSISLNGQLSDLYVLKQNNVLHNFKKFKAKSINEYQWNYYGFSRVNSFWYFISIFLPHIVSKPYSKFFLVQISSKAKIKYMLKMSQKCDCDKTKQTKKTH